MNPCPQTRTPYCRVMPRPCNTTRNILSFGVIYHPPSTIVLYKESPPPSEKAIYAPSVLLIFEKQL